MQSYVAALRKYATFAGRSRRREFWMFTVVDMGVAAVLFALSLGASYALDGRHSYVSGTLLALFAAYWVGSLLPGLAVRVRRLHDVGRSGAYLLVGLIPLIGPLMLLVEFCMDGTHGPNRHGPDPKAAPRPQPAGAVSGGAVLSSAGGVPTSAAAPKRPVTVAAAGKWIILRALAVVGIIAALLLLCGGLQALVS